jgi:hypothetical protein
VNRNLVEGRVLDENGSPVAGAYVTLQSDDSSVQDIAGVTTTEGRFRLKLPSGDFSVHAITKSGMHGMARLSQFNEDKFFPVILLHS